MKAEFLCTTRYPEGGLPEIAFAGRSNVGKSSLINTLVGRKNLVRTSKTPGRTRELGFFGVDDRYVFVDLPGYGYAKVSKTERASWQPMVERYLDSREVLALVVLVVDCRRDPREEERAFLDWLDERGILAIAAATKVDKLKRSQRARRLAAQAEGLEIDPDRVVPFSSVTREGRDAMWRTIREAAAR